MTGLVEQKRVVRLTQKVYDHVRASYMKLAELEDWLEEAREELSNAISILNVMERAKEEGEEEEEEDSPSFPPREPGEQRWYDSDEDPDSALG